VQRELIAGALFISPWVIGFLWFTIYPMGKALYYSFTNFDLLQPPRWVGLDNYRTAFSNDPLFWQSLLNTGIYALMTLPAGTAFSIGLALLLDARVRGQAVFRAIFFVPTVLPLVATSVVWTTALDPQWGYINAILRLVGVSHPPGWLAEPFWTKPAFALMSLWTVGTAVIIYLAALQGVPQQLIEAASLDGAGPIRRFWHVTLPMISPAILFNVVLGLIGTFQFFTQPFIMAGPTGGALQSGLFYSPYLWENGFSYFKMGYASALAWILFTIILIATVLVIYFSRNRVYYEEAL
jgi:multiple sugar transport system permease protein